MQESVDILPNMQKGQLSPHFMIAAHCIKSRSLNITEFAKL